MSDQSLLITFPLGMPTKVRALRLINGRGEYLDALGRWLELDSLSAAWQGSPSQSTTLTIDGLLAYRVGSEGPVLGPEEGFSLKLGKGSGLKYHASLISPSRDMVAYHASADTWGWRYTVNAGDVGEVDTSPYLYLAGPWFFGETFYEATEVTIIPGVRSRLSPLAEPQRLQLA
jgi:hypothetical protein